MGDEQNTQQDREQQPDQAPQQTDTAPVSGGQAEPQGEPSWLGPRLERAKNSAIKDMLAELGIEDRAALKKMLTDFNVLREQQMSETEKREQDLERERKTREQAEQRLQQLEQQQRNDRIDAAIRAEAAKLRAEHPEDVITWARDRGSVDGLLDAEGKVVEAEVIKLVKQAREDRPKWFVGTGPGSPSNSDGRAPEPDAKAKAAAATAMRRRAQHTF